MNILNIQRKLNGFSESFFSGIIILIANHKTKCLKIISALKHYWRYTGSALMWLVGMLEYGHRQNGGFTKHTERKTERIDFHHLFPKQVAQ